MKLKTLRAFVLPLLLSCSSARAETLIFVATIDTGPGLNYNWMSGNNWYTLNEDGLLMHAYRLPQVTDGAYIQTPVLAGGGAITLAGLTTGPSAKVEGGHFTVSTLGMLNASTLSAATATVTSAMTTDGPTYLESTRMTIDSGASALISYTAPRTTGSLSLSGDSLINNQGSFVLAPTASLGALGPCRFNNQTGADLRANGNAQVSAGGATFVFDNRGTVRAEHGTLLMTGLQWTSTSGSGTFLAAAPDAVIQFSNGTFGIDSGTTFFFKGPGRHLFTGGLRVDGTMNVGAVDSPTTAVDPGVVELAPTSASGTGVIHVLADGLHRSMLRWKSGRLAVSRLDIDPGAELEITGAGGSGTSYLDTGTVNHSGIARMTGNAGIQFENGVVFNNLPGALFDVQADTWVSASPAAGTFNNSGEFRKSAGSFTTQVGAAFTNTGRVDVQSGTLRFLRGFNQTAGTTVIRAGSIVTADNPGFNLQGGVLQGTGTLNGSVLNNATVSPGLSAGVLTLGASSSFTQTASGILNVEIGGLTAGTQYDRLVIGGIATLSGTLRVTLTGGYTPAPGDTFTVLTCGSRSGTFDWVSGSHFTGQLALKPVYSSTGVALVVTAVETVPWIQLAPAAGGPSGGMVLTWPAQAGNSYQVEYSSDLEVWNPLQRVIAAGPTATATDPVPAAVAGRRFYRLR